MQPKDKIQYCILCRKSFPAPYSGYCSQKCRGRAQKNGQINGGKVASSKPLGSRSVGHGD